MNARSSFQTRFWSVGLVLLLVLLPISVPTAQADSAVINPAVLVKDINTATRSAGPQLLSAVGNRLLFSADDGINGASLWATDTTGSGAFLIKAITPLSPIVMIRGIGYFAARDAAHGAELWRTDGTGAGTQLVADINPGAADSYPYALTAGNDTLFFFANQNDLRPTLWKSDGTSAGTLLVTDQTAAAGMLPYQLTFLNGKLFIVLSATGPAFQLWVSDGADAGTRLLKKFPANSATSTVATTKESNVPIEPPFDPQLTAVNGTVFFRADDGSQGMELWKSDGTPAGTVLLTDLTPGPGSSSLQSFTHFRGMLFFITAEGLWKSNGTATGAQLVKPGKWESPVVAGDLLFIVGTDSDQGQELWRSDGTSAGTILVKDIHPGQTPTLIVSLTPLNNQLFFMVKDGNHGTALWQSDGTATGTALVKVITPGLYTNQPILLTVVGGRLFFPAFDFQHGSELWRSDGTEAGTALHADINQQPDSSWPAQFIPIGERLFFTAQDNVGLRYLWRSDGSSEGTQRIEQPGFMGSGTDFIAQPLNNDLYIVSHNQHKLWRIDSVSGTPTLLLELTNAWITEMAVMNNRVYFLIGGTEPQGSALWQSDGTAAGTQVVKAVEAAPDLFVHNNTLYFVAHTAETGTELWQSDGTTSGTRLLKDINPGAGSSEPGQLSTLQGALFFIANDGSHGKELWQSDGSPDGTQMVKDSNPGINDGAFAILTNTNDTLFFTANDGSHGVELWKSDGVAEGTLLVKDTFPGPEGNDFYWAKTINNQIFFIRGEGQGNYALWVSDGSEAGTYRLKDVRPDAQNAYLLSALWLTEVNNKLLFVTDDAAAGGAELWVSDGTTAGTQLLKEINPGPADADPSVLTNVNGVVLFGAIDGSGQRALWRTDGTAAGTQLLQAIAPPPNPYYWQQPAFAVAGANIFFSAGDSTNGQELWKIPLTPNQATLKTHPLVSVATDGIGQLQIDYGNQSNSLQQQVSLTAVLDPKLTYLASSGPVTPTLQGNTLVWQLPDLAPLASGEIELHMQAPTAPLGTRYLVTLTLSTVTGGASPVQNVTNVEVMVAAPYYLPLIKR